jgi:hypothetical protein
MTQVPHWLTSWKVHHANYGESISVESNVPLEALALKR